jgi:hypothetical protein
MRFRAQLNHTFICGYQKLPRDGTAALWKARHDALAASLRETLAAFKEATGHDYVPALLRDPDPAAITDEDRAWLKRIGIEG